MKNQIKLLLVAFTISLGVFACKGSVNTAEIGTTPPEDSVKTEGIDVKDSHTDTASSHLDTTKVAPVDTTKK